jgi:hypothetical protein
MLTSSGNAAGFVVIRARACCSLAHGASLGWNRQNADGSPPPASNRAGNTQAAAGISPHRAA